MAPVKTNTLLTVDLILLLLNVSLCIIFTNGKAEIPPASKIATEISEEEVCDVWNSFVDVVAEHWKVLFLSRWAISVISYFLRFEHENETEDTLLIVDLAQALLIFIDVGLCHVYASKIVRVIPPVVLEDAWNNFVDGVAEFWREILGGAGALLFTVGLLGYMDCKITRGFGCEEDVANCPDV